MTSATACESHIPTVKATAWLPRGFEKVIGFSAQHWVALSNDGRTVLKYPHYKTSTNMNLLYSEAKRYEILGPHDSLVCYKGRNDDGLVLEFCEKGQLCDVIDSRILTHQHIFAISKQIVLGVAYLHQQRLVHCDLNTRNIFVTSNLDAKIGDMQGQLYNIDGTINMPTISQENAKSRHPHAGEDEFSVRTDIFALGTVLYHLSYGHPPFPTLDEYRDEIEIQTRYRRGSFPIDVTNATGIDDIIVKCWISKYNNASEVLEAIYALENGAGLAQEETSDALPHV